MRKYIRKLQSKSESTRKQILVGSLIVCMSFVGLIWVNSLGYKFNKENFAKTQEDIKPFALFGQTISDTYNNVTASVGNISSSLKKEEPKTVEKIKNEKQIDLIPVEYSN
ncbi:MAG: hypothetical protein WC839_04260 [Candidatus Paceibacterota bacterium]